MPPPTPDKIKVLFFAANPTGTDPLALDEEAREIEAKIRASEHRNALELIIKWAVRLNAGSRPTDRRTRMIPRVRMPLTVSRGGDWASTRFWRRSARETWVSYTRHGTPSSIRSWP